MLKTDKPTHAWGIAGLILGILSLVLFLAPYIGIFLAITAIVFYNIQKKHEPTGVATTGLVTGIIGIIINTIMLIFVIISFFAIGTLWGSSTNEGILSEDTSIETTINNSINNKTDIGRIEVKKQTEELTNSIYNEEDIINIVSNAKDIANNNQQKLTFWNKYSFPKGDMKLIAFTPYANTVSLIAGKIEKYDEYTLDEVKTYLNFDNVYTTAFNVKTSEMYSEWDTSDLRAIIEYDAGKICRGKIGNVESEIGDWTGGDITYKTSISATFNCFKEIHNEDVRFIYIAGNQKVYFDVAMKNLK